jgi:lipoprotein
MRRKKMALALLATAGIVLVTACGRKKNSDTTAAESASSAVESVTETASGESTDPGDENVVYDTLSPEEQASIEASEAAEEAEENVEEAEEETGAKGAETKSQAKATRQTYPSQIFHEGEDTTEAPETDSADDSGPTGKVTKIKKNKAGNYVKPESTSRAVEPPSDATMPESGH